jgi:hypothetical protein
LSIGDIAKVYRLLDWEVAASLLGGQVAMWFDFGTTFLDRGPGELPSFEWAIAPPPLGKSTITSLPGNLWLIEIRSIAL